MELFVIPKCGARNYVAEAAPQLEMRKGLAWAQTVLPLEPIRVPWPIPITFRKS